MTLGSHPEEPPLDAPFVDWLTWALVQHGYDLDARGVQRRIAEATGIPPGTISRLLRSAHQPDVSTCYALAKTFGVAVLPLLVRAGHLPAEALDKALSERPPSPETEEEALSVLGVHDHHDQEAVRNVINALRAKDRRQEGTS